MDKIKLIKLFATLAAIALIAGGLVRIVQRSFVSLTDYEKQNSSTLSSESSVASEADAHGKSESSSDQSDTSESGDEDKEEAAAPVISSLIGATLNGTAVISERFTYSEGFYCEPLSDHLRRYISGISFITPDRGQSGADLPVPESSDNSVDSAAADASGTSDVSKAADDSDLSADSISVETVDNPDRGITEDELRYVHIWHFDFDGKPVEGELICNESIAIDLLEIFCELYRSEYQIESLRLIEEFDGDVISAMESNNSSCLKSQGDLPTSEGSAHASGLAVDINPYYNPYLSYSAEDGETVLPAAAAEYADRTKRFAYKIDEQDLCYKLFTAHGFTWGGNRNSIKAYGHFQKTMP